MAPPKVPAPPYSKNEKVLCFHHEMLYNATVLEVQQNEDSSYQYKIHYKGWKKTWDDWVPQDRIRKYNDENRELEKQLMQQARATQKSAKPNKSIVLKGGSDFSSARGSEERTAGSAAVSGRGGPARRARDYDMEHVSLLFSFPFFLSPSGLSPFCDVECGQRQALCCGMCHRTPNEHQGSR